jgi:hypothetical protein
MSASGPQKYVVRLKHFGDTVVPVKQNIPDRPTVSLVRAWLAGVAHALTENPMKPTPGVATLATLAGPSVAGVSLPPRPSPLHRVPPSQRPVRAGARPRSQPETHARERTARCLLRMTAPVVASRSGTTFASGRAARPPRLGPHVRAHHVHTRTPAGNMPASSPSAAPERPHHRGRHRLRPGGGGVLDFVLQLEAERCATSCSATTCSPPSARW